MSKKHISFGIILSIFLLSLSLPFADSLDSVYGYPTTPQRAVTQVITYINATSIYSYNDTYATWAYNESTPFLALNYNQSAPYTFGSYNETLSLLPKLYWNLSGNALIPTSPALGIVVSGGIYSNIAGAGFRHYYGGGTSNAEFSQRSDSNTQIYSWNGTAYKDILLGVDGATVGGNVGIGTTGPTTKLDVTGTVNATSFSLNDNYLATFGSAQDWAVKANDTAFYINRQVGSTNVVIPLGNLLVGSKADATYPIQTRKDGSTLSGNFKSIATLIDSADAKGIALGYDSSSTTATIAGYTSGAASDIAFWTYNGAAWGEKSRIISTGKFAFGNETTDVRDTNAGSANPFEMTVYQADSQGGNFGVNAFSSGVGISLNKVNSAGKNIRRVLFELIDINDTAGSESGGVVIATKPTTGTAIGGITLLANGNAGVNNSAPLASWHVNGTIRGNYTSVDGTKGLTATCSPVNSLTIKEGIIVACS